MLDMHFLKNIFWQIKAIFIVSGCDFWHHTFSFILWIYVLSLENFLEIFFLHLTNFSTFHKLLKDWETCQHWISLACLTNFLMFQKNQKLPAWNNFFARYKYSSLDTFIKKFYKTSTIFIKLSAIEKTIWETIDNLINVVKKCAIYLTNFTPSF